MADITGLFAVSHTPVMTSLPGAPEPEVSAEVYRQYRRVGQELAASDPDVVLLISDDHLHNFFLDNMPAFCVGTGTRYDSPVEGWLKVEPRVLPGDQNLGTYLVDSCFAAGFDPAFSMELTLDHGMVTPLELAGVSGRWPVVPLLVNTVQPPMPTMKRCIDLGAAVGDALRRYDGCERIAVLATGGISHDVGTPRMGFVNEEFDRRFLDLIADGEPTALARFAQDEVNSAGNGAEEVRNWLVAHGIARCTPFEPYHYRAVHEWYTGIALGRWQTA